MGNTEKHRHKGKSLFRDKICKLGLLCHSWLFIWISVLKFPPGQHLGEAEENPGGESVCGSLAVEADSEAATSAVVVGRGHEIVVCAGFHGCKDIKLLLLID
jgi:hypothetical protein